MAPILYQEHMSHWVDKVLKDIDARRIVIISFGMKFLIRPLLKQSRYANCLLIANSFFVPVRSFRCGKKDIALEYVPGTVINKSEFITDSLDDEDLLSHCKNGYLIQPQGKLNQAKFNLYLPLRYTVGAKYRPAYVMDQVIFVDLCVFIISTLNPPSFLLPVNHFMTCLLFLLSVLCIYELGYLENDNFAVRKEVNPRLSDDVGNYTTYPVGVSPWIWSFIFYAAATSLSRNFEGTLFSYIGSLSLPTALWISGLVYIRSIFFIYNRIAPGSRVMLYPMLQIGKYLIIFSVLAPSIPGAIIIPAQIITLWMNYIVYRGGGTIERKFLEYFRVFSIGLSLIIIVLILLWNNFGSSNYAIGLNDLNFSVQSTVLLLVWCAFRIYKPVLKALVHK